MKCSCCGKKKGIFDSFEELDKDVFVCVECSKLLYKYQDCIKEKKEEEVESLYKQIEKNKRSIEFDQWFGRYKKRLCSTEETTEKDNDNNDTTDSDE